MSIGLDLSSPPRVDIKAVAAEALRSLPNLLGEWLPGGRREGHEYTVRNPTRADNRPGSFKINMQSGKWSDFASGDEGGDAVALFAYLNGTTQVEAARAVADRLGMGQTVAGLATVAGHQSKTDAGRKADGWRPILPVPADAPRIGDELPKRLAPRGLTLVKGYRYEDGAGRLLGHVARYEGEINGEREKSFFPFTYCEGHAGHREWRSKGFPRPRPLYGLRWLAERPGDPVLVTEGEKSAQAAYKLFPAYVSVTSSGGSKAAREADWSPLAGRDVVVWPDADEPGARYAADVVETATQARARSVVVVALPAGLPEGWDLADDMPPGLAVADLERLLTGAKPAQPEGPLPLFPPLPPAEPFPVEALGPVLSRAAAAIARKVQVPEAMAAQSVLATAALAAQAHADVRLPYGQVRPLSLFFVTVAQSGDRKSSADNEALWPVVRREKALREAHVDDMKAWKIEQAAWSAEHRKIEANKNLSMSERKDALTMIGEEPARPLAPFLVTGDLTVEGLTKNWINAHPALGIFTAEAGTFTGGHGMSDDSRLRTAAMLSEVWDGKPVKRVRALDGVTILPGRRLAMHLMVQPGAAAGFLGNATLRDQGLLSRVLVSAPASLAGTRLHRAVDPADDRAIQAYGARILSLLEAEPATVEGVPNELDPRALDIEPAAAAALSAFADHVERQVGAAEGLKPIGDFAAKAAEHAARIAGVLAIVASRQATSVGPAEMEAALALADWYVTETLRLHQAGRRDPKLLVAHALLDWMQKRGEPEVLFRDVLQLGPSETRTKAAAEAALDILKAHGWIADASPRPRSFRLAAEAP